MAQAEQNLNDPERVSIAVNLEFEQKLVRPQEVTLVVFVPDLAIGSPSPITEAPRRVDSNRVFEFSEDIPAFAGQEDSRLFVLVADASKPIHRKIRNFLIGETGRLKLELAPTGQDFRKLLIEQIQGSGAEVLDIPIQSADKL